MKTPDTFPAFRVTEIPPGPDNPLGYPEIVMTLRGDYSPYDHSVAKDVCRVCSAGPEAETEHTVHGTLVLCSGIKRIQSRETSEISSKARLTIYSPDPLTQSMAHAIQQSCSCHPVLPVHAPDPDEVSIKRSIVPDDDQPPETEMDR